MRIINWIKENKILILIVFIGSVLRFYKLDYQSIWLDEICSFIESDPQKGMMDIYEFVKAYDPHPPFYYLSLHYVFAFFGYTTFVMRAYSSVLGILGIISLYFLGKELINKKIGLTAAGLLAINQYHIYYSQEGRMYTLLFLTTTLSFYFLIRFIKEQTIKRAALFVVFSTLMIYSHFFALFVLVSQYLIILFFLFHVPKEERKKLFLLSFISGILTIILWIPALKILLEVAKVESSWIPLPPAEVFSILLKGFFGNAESIFYIVILLIIFYFMNVFHKVKNDQTLIIENKNLFCFVIVAIWIFVTLMIPYIRTYTNIPIMVDRYFTSILPAILLMAAIGLISIKNDLVKTFIIVILISASLIEIIFVKDYYNKITKTQFREISQKIIEQNQSKDIVVTTWAWHFNSFLNKDGILTKEKTLQDYVNEMEQNPSNLKSFWFVGAHFQKYQLDTEAEVFLNENFNLTDKLEFFDTWANHYISKTNTAAIKEVSNKKIDINSFGLNSFKSVATDNNGHLTLFENANLKTDFFNLEKGNYKLIIKGNSLPEKPINGENAHFKIRLNGDEIANFNLSENKNNPEKIISFKNNNEKVRIQLIYDNDVFENGNDRNAIIYSISLKKE